METITTSPKTISAKKWGPLIISALGVAIASGSLSAAFLRGLDYVTALRFHYPNLIYGLPIAGVCMVAAYRRFGGMANRGNDLLVERIRMQNGPAEARMAPLIFCSTLLSHLCGASTGREGAAVQMGGGIASLLIRVNQIPASSQQALLVAGVSAGFASIFGTPLAGAMFALEVATPLRPIWRHLPLAVGSALLADWTARMWGITHVAYTIPMPDWEQWSQLPMLAGLGVAALAFGMAGKMFLRMHHGIMALQEKGQFVWWLPPFLGGSLLVALSQLPGTSDYLGLGAWSINPAAVTLSSAFSEHGAQAWSWLAKLTLTALSLGSGFKGGEVTPLFFTGATLGNVIAGPLGLPVPLCAGLGFVAVFAGAAHTPLSGAVLAAELFGWSAFPLFLATCWLAHWTCGRAGLYASQER